MGGNVLKEGNANNDSKSSVVGNWKNNVAPARK